MPVSRFWPGAIPALLLSTAPIPPRSAPQPSQETGHQVFTTVCAQCHTIQPPPSKAPPMSHIARRYVMAAADRDDAIQRIAAWVRHPDPDRSLLPARAIEMFGTMPPLGLTDEQARAVAGYIVTLADSANGTGAGRGMMRDTAAMGMGRGRGMMRGTTAAGMGRGRGMMRRDTIRR